MAVVTGAARGIGKAIAETLAGNGALVAAFDLVAPEHPGILGVACDVSDEAAVDRAFTEVEQRLGTVSVLVLNAGIFPVVPFEEMTLETWNRCLAINLTGGSCARAGRCRACASSTTGASWPSGRPRARRAARAPWRRTRRPRVALMTLAKSIANEYAAHGITSNALAPTLIETDMIEGMRDLQSRIPVGRFGRPMRSRRSSRSSRPSTRVTSRAR